MIVEIKGVKWNASVPSQGSITRSAARIRSAHTRRPFPPGCSNPELLHFRAHGQVVYIDMSCQKGFAETTGVNWQ